MWGTTWFGGQGTGGQKRKDAPKKAILDLRQQLDMLQKRERHLMNQMDKQDEVARENVTSNKTGMSYLTAPSMRGLLGAHFLFCIDHFCKENDVNTQLPRKDEIRWNADGRLMTCSCPKCPETKEAA